jgi:NAD-dependent DNA ligase
MRPGIEPTANKKEERAMDTRVLKQYLGAARGRRGNAAALEAMRMKAATLCLCAAHPDIAFKARTFCFTGRSPRMRRDALAALVRARGGIWREGVSGKTDYLVVGSGLSPGWKYRCMGEKLARAMQLQRAGSGIQIVWEDDFWHAV